MSHERDGPRYAFLGLRELIDARLARKVELQNELTLLELELRDAHAFLGGRTPVDATT